MNKGNHSVRGGSQGHNLVSPDADHLSTKDRLRSPQIRVDDGSRNGKLVDIDWDTLNRVMAKLIVKATGMHPDTNNKKIVVDNPGGLGAKVFEYQYLENTFAATKLFYSAIGTPNVAFHDRPSAAGSSPALRDVGMRPHDFAYEDIRHSDVIFMIGTNPYENQSVFFMQHCAGKEIIVMDPRETATAQYAVQTGGMHVRPQTLGADSLVAYAIAREILKKNNENEVLDWLRQRELGPDLDPDNRRYGDLWRLATDLDIEQIGNSNPFDKRKRSRVGSLDEMLEFLGVDDSNSTYTLDNAAAVSGIDKEVLDEVVERISAKRSFPGSSDQEETRRPRVAILYEKGVI